jgi:hypothetical protein
MSASPADGRLGYDPIFPGSREGAPDTDVPEGPEAVGRLIERIRAEEPVEVARPALTWTTRQPSGPTLAHWLTDAGFSRVMPTDDGGRAAAALFDRLPEAARPRTLAEVDALLRPVVTAALATPRPAADDSMFTAVR